MIVNTEYYFSIGFENREGEEQSLEKAIARAERLIDIASFGKVRGFETLHETALERLKYAICVQAEWFLTHGYDSAADSIDHKVKIGDFSYESRNNGVQNNLAPEAQGVLKLAGLLYAGTEAK
jgi:hypothetical protein